MLYNTFKDVDTIRIKMQFQDFYDTWYRYKIGTVLDFHVNQIPLQVFDLGITDGILDVYNVGWYATNIEYNIDDGQIEITLTSKWNYLMKAIKI
jgi:hypothetical protein